MDASPLVVRWAGNGRLPPARQAGNDPPAGAAMQIPLLPAFFS
jgi:hypothetical protein